MIPTTGDFSLDRESAFVEIQQAIVTHYRNLPRITHKQRLSPAMSAAGWKRTHPRGVVWNLGVQLLNITVEYEEHDSDDKEDD